MEPLTRDTICAPASPMVPAAVAIVRLAGPDALAIADKLWKGKRLAQAVSHTAHLGTIVSPDGETVDQALATVFRAPNSFTGDDIVEFSCHGSPIIVQQLMALLVAAGAREANPGEFTQRAFLSGKMDLTQAEAVADLIAAKSRAAHRLAISQLKGNFAHKLRDMRQKLIDLAALLELELDFSEEDVVFADRDALRQKAEELKTEIDRLAATFRAGQAFKEGYPVAIIGRPNAGKSTLLNALAEHDRAIVSDIPGTTRDTLEETIQIDGCPIRIIDSAGLHATDDPVEKLGIRRSLRALSQAQTILLLLDPLAPDPRADAALFRRLADKQPAKIIPIITKADVATETQMNALQRQLPADGNPLIISAKEGTGIERLRRQLASRANAGLDPTTDLIVANARHHRALLQASASLAAVLAALTPQPPVAASQQLAASTRAPQASAAQHPAVPVNAMPLSPAPQAPADPAALTPLVNATPLSPAPELLALDLRQALSSIGEITGEITPTDLLSSIFSRFCIGK